jgi:glycosyltransferase involved in cell wall biosynthesis
VTGGSPLLSFVIPVRDDAARLERCLASIRACTGTGSPVEIVVVDNGSADASPAVARAAGARVIDAPGLSVAELRNAGAAAAAGAILAFVDADHEIAAGWIAAAADTLAAPGAGIAGTLCEAPADGTWVQRMYDTFRARAPRPRDVEWLGSGNMAVRREVFEATGGFDARLETCEDVDLCTRARRLGWRVVDDPRMRNIHFGDPATLRALFVGELWRGRDNLRASLRSLTWRGLPSLVIPVAHLGLAGVVVAAAFTAPFLGPWPAVAAVASMALLTAPRAVVMLSRLPGVSASTAAQAWAVAAVYDMARAFAPVSRISHARRARAGRA